MKFDETDIEIIKALRNDARLKMADLAKELGITKSAVSIRWKKIKQSGIITDSTIDVNLDKLGYHCLGNFGIYAIPSKIDECMKYLETIEGIDWCYPTMGAFDIFGWISLKNMTKMREVKDKIRKHPAVLDVKILLHTDYGKKLVKINNIPLENLMRL